jgi:AmiR/NasT family two-component response regulator
VAQQRGFTELLSTLGSGQRHAPDSEAEWERQKTVERATGVLMERHGLSADAAAERIRQMAARQGIAVEEAAARLLGQPSAGGRRRSGR